MTIEINLLPWRVLKRDKEKKFLILLLLFSLALSGLTVLAINYYVVNLVQSKTRINSHLQAEIALLNHQVNEIKTIKNMCKLLNARMDIIKSLQNSRILIIHFFDELVKIVPDEVYLIYVHRADAQIQVFGRAKSNHAVSVMMRNIALNHWFNKPVLTEIKNNKESRSFAINEFKLSFMVRDEDSRN